jgi:hypothetical protein
MSCAGAFLHGHDIDYFSFAVLLLNKSKGQADLARQKVFQAFVLTPIFWISVKKSVIKVDKWVCVATIKIPSLYVVRLIAIKKTNSRVTSSYFLSLKIKNWKNCFG